MDLEYRTNVLESRSESVKLVKFFGEFLPWNDGQGVEALCPSSIFLKYAPRLPTCTNRSAASLGVKQQDAFATRVGVHGACAKPGSTR